MAASLALALARTIRTIKELEQPASFGPTSSFNTSTQSAIGAERFVYSSDDMDTSSTGSDQSISESCYFTRSKTGSEDSNQYDSQSSDQILTDDEGTTPNKRPTKLPLTPPLTPRICIWN